MNYFLPYSMSNLLCSETGQYIHWPNHYLPPIYGSSLPVTAIAPHCSTSSDTGQTELHFIHGPVPISPWHYGMASPWQQSFANPPPAQRPDPVKPAPRLGHSQPPVGPSWPEGFTLKGELRWGRLEKVFGPHREVPDFVSDDLRRVYGTYPHTDVSIRHQRGEFVVHGNPRVGEQEYRVERKVTRQLESPEAESLSMQAERRRKRRARRVK